VKLAPKEERVLVEYAQRLLRNPEHRRKLMSAGPQPIPIEKLLQQYGKIHLQLVNAEEQIGQARNTIDSLQKTVAAKEETINDLKQKLAAANEADNTEAAEKA
jgi:predicted  nucleic acid-binding Zn-ribbon protein